MAIFVSILVGIAVTCAAIGAGWWLSGDPEPENPHVFGGLFPIRNEPTDRRPRP